MKKVTWIAQLLLAFAFGMSGFMKFTTPHSELITIMAWAEDFSSGAVKLISFLEMLAAIGLILPALTRKLVQIIPMAATGLAMIMIGAMAVHIGRAEFSMLPVNATLLGLAVITVYGRLKHFNLDEAQNRES